WFYELKHKKKSSTFDVPDAANALKHVESRYKLHPKYITAVRNASPLTQICLNQHDSEKSRCDVADVAYRFEKDLKDYSVFHSNSTSTVSVNGDALDIEQIRIYCVDEEPPGFCMRQLVGGIRAAVILTAGFGIAGLVFLRWLQTRKYEKVEIKEMSEIRTRSLQLP
ncbi:LOW QUALITY PROTEIN: tumor-associated calcium signal transducer 2, partial [Chlamydotis macqueenii]